MKIARLTFIAIFVVSLAVGIVPGALHPFSWKIALIDWGVLIALLGPASGFFAGPRSLQIAFGVVCILAALAWGAVPFIPTDIDRERSELYIWAYYESLFVIGSIVGLRSLKKEPNQSLDPTAPSRRGSS
jgi:peptidoglycan/LPS O-acetylase OafA/YrhL